MTDAPAGRGAQGDSAMTFAEAADGLHLSSDNRVHDISADLVGLSTGPDGAPVCGSGIVVSGAGVAAGWSCDSGGRCGIM